MVQFLPTRTDGFGCGYEVFSANGTTERDEAFRKRVDWWPSYRFKMLSRDVLLPKV